MEQQRQQTLQVVFEYAPSNNMMGLIGRLVVTQFLPPPFGGGGGLDITQDRLEQSVLLDCRQGGGVDSEDTGVLELRPRGTRISGTRFGGDNLVPALNLQDEGDILASLPIALSCRIVYNDGDLRIDRSQVDQGNYLGVYRRIR